MYMERYELLYIIPAKYTEAEIAQLMERIKGVVIAAGANVSEMHDLGKRKLAYPIQHVRHGNYVLAYFEADAAAVAKLNDTLRLSAEILRHMIVARDPYLTNIPSLVEVEQRAEGDDAPRPRQMAAPVQQAPVAVKDPLTMEELDKKLDEILTEEVL
jgi:small subunit ribosomal protein S6